MAHSLPIQYDFSLRNHNTFGVEANAHAYLPIASADMLVKVKSDITLAAMPRLVLGGGSNILLTRDFPGLVLHMEIKGIEIVGEDDDATYVRAAAGENWHQFVQWTLAHNLGGLENLSLIPGSVGAAPIQNIGAYGIEIKDRFHSLTLFDFETGEQSTLDKADCMFGYRDSVFKHCLRDKAVVLDVTFALPKKWQAVIRYADVTQELAARKIAEPTAQDISAAVIAIRTRKLPDPAMIGNAGSFFKNPVVTPLQRDALLATYPQLVNYAQPDGSVKLAAGWLIDQCGWKGKTAGAAGVYENQALVLVNRGGASGTEIAQLAAAIQADVAQRFDVQLEPEPIFL
ncbi:UDP-N-acetylmuramate dehydrogenase [Herminiimonas fonticola]|uniref:UDP-N-acetylenolpyruvoylglucosamine reductase n=1 Tax=Herminiimonas fonticola TaxID=303380 RepID=A0A4R6G7P3_9BURK|nr:UDP-N-acetylmuramate dehydrogenase [Herminiimonas fonticola]RBA23783.1 murB: UDP-N-acetylenolpyruvoylglucosamine reductase [Herminiimonas fonticola]TDN89785.1 UDP-N-acetylmuramate dehydrogenase [Herminiimonas fonticola]